MSKIWQIMPKTEEDLIKKYPRYDRLTLQLLFNRGLTGKKEIEKFLDPDYKYSPDPFLFNQMEEAVSLIITAIKEREKIVIYGDYDADGVTAVAVLLDVLNKLAAIVEVYIPDRISEGYGLNRAAIEEISRSGAGLVITVDNGIRNKEEVDFARSLGLKIIITDHHVPPTEAAELPASPIVNPILEKENYPFKYLAGVGVAMKLAQALIKKSTLKPAEKEKLEESVLDLVAIGTIADCVTLTGENRVLTKRGLVALNKTKRVGLKELLREARINEYKKLDSWNVSFQIAPRLNAAGRMDHANTAFELLATKNKEEAKILAKNLNQRNSERQKITNEMVFAIEKNIRGKRGDKRIIVAVSPSVGGDGDAWPEGVIGLVAGRICEKYYLPTIVITDNGDELKGSGRSIDEFNIIKAVEESAEFLHKFGGHAAACGFSLAGQKNLEGFIKKIESIANVKLAGKELKPRLNIEAELSPSEISQELVEKIEGFSPFGEDNPRPVFLTKEAQIVDIINMGLEGQHIKLRIKKEGSAVLSALAFGRAEEWRYLKIGDKIDLVYYLEMNEFNGRREAQLKIIDLKKH